METNKNQTPQAHGVNWGGASSAKEQGQSQSVKWEGAQSNQGEQKAQAQAQAQDKKESSVFKDLEAEAQAALERVGQVGQQPQQSQGLEGARLPKISLPEVGGGKEKNQEREAAKPPAAKPPKAQNKSREGDLSIGF